MDNNKMGDLIFRLRSEKKMTQQQVGNALNVSNKTISKWERGAGCPDISLLQALSKVLDANIEQLLAGELNQNQPDGGNMKRIKFYVCPDCGNIVTATGAGEMSCCGRKLEALSVKDADSQHMPKVEEIENDYYVTFQHEMKKEHFLSFVACVSYDRILLVRMYPEQDAAVRFPSMGRGSMYFYCTEHGLMKSK